jgi:hypothetical protein
MFGNFMQENFLAQKVNGIRIAGGKASRTGNTEALGIVDQTGNLMPGPSINSLFSYKSSSTPLFSIRFPADKRLITYPHT